MIHVLNGFALMLEQLISCSCLVCGRFGVQTVEAKSYTVLQIALTSTQVAVLWWCWCYL